MRRDKTALLTLLACTTFASGCESKDRSKTTATGAPAANDKREEDAPPADFSHFDTERLRRLWQGAWVVENQGRPQAWHVQGGRVTVSRGTDKKERDFVFPSPCQVGIEDVSPSGKYTEIVSFAVDGDAVYAGDDNAAYRQGSDFVACADGGVWISKGGACSLWKKELGPGKMVWKRNEGTCKTSKDGRGELVELTSSRSKVFGPTKVYFAGQKGGPTKLTKYASLDEALAQLKK
jgi:hypothetical protein